jgi:methionine sulfoxide reductase catalytic subunit
MSPAIEARFPWFVKLLGGKQGARSLHFIGLVLWALFGVVHIVLVFVVHFQDNVRNIVYGDSPGAANASLALAMGIFFGSLALAVLIAAWASWYSLGHRRRMQHILGAVVDPIRMLSMQHLTTRQHYQHVSPYFWTNGYPPATEEYKKLVETDFAEYRLEVCGLVDTPLRLSLDDLRQMTAQTQTTLHNCIQGWSGIATWTGVPVPEILRLCGASPRAKYLVFTSYQQGKQSFPPATQARERPFYEVIPRIQAEHPQTILALAMNGQPLPIEHGAPVRLRVETYLGYKMVKWVRSIELVDEYTHIWDGQGGFREDNQYFGRSAEI